MQSPYPHGKTICLHMLESLAIPFVLELARQFEERFPGTQFVFVIPYPHLAIKFREAHGGSPAILCDPFRETPLASFDRKLTNEDWNEIRRIEQVYHPQRGFWFAVGEERAFLYSRQGASIHKMNRKMPRDIMLLATLNRYKRVEQFFQEHSVDTVLFASQDCGTMMGTACYWVGTKMGIQIQMPLMALVQNKTFFTPSYIDPVKRLDEAYRKYLTTPPETKKEALDFLQENRRRGLQKAYSHAEAVNKPLGINKFRRIIKAHRDFRQGNPNQFYNDRSPYQAVMGKLQIKRKRKWLRKHIALHSATSVGKYVYFPLHLEPELALIVCAPYQMNQVGILQNIARSLPADVCLAVKEHPVIGSNFPLSFYEQVANTPNVLFLDPTEKTNEIIRGSVGVMAITGTAALEAVILGKPSLTFGNVYFNTCHSVHTFESWEKIHDLVVAMEQETINDNDLASFLQAVMDISYPLNLLDLVGNEHPEEVIREMTSKFLDAFVDHTEELRKCTGDA